MSRKMPPRSSSADNDDDAYKAKEFDNTLRQTTVKLFTRPVDTNLPDRIEYHHWALIFIFEGNDIRTAEGYPDEQEMLYPKYTKLYPKECGKYYLVGTVHTSPTNILEMSKANYYNNTKYIATWQNCQTWVKELAYKMGGEVAKKIDEFKTLKEANPVVAVVGKKKNAVGLRSFSS